MLACIACVKEDGGRDGDAAARRSAAGGGGDTPTCRDPVRSLSSQVRQLPLSFVPLLLTIRCLLLQ
jgi:hypothetical protein